MSQIAVDEKISAGSSQLCEPTRITDPQGCVLGVFIPSPQPDEKPLFDLEEAERISKEEAGRGRRLGEFWADIRAGRSFPMTAWCAS